mgnify:CR=1 FL=1
MSPPHPYPTRILIVDDDRGYRTFLNACLRGRGHDVRIADGGAAALRCWEDADGCFDLVLTDLNMPGMSGLELRDELLRRRPGARVVVISAGRDGDGPDGVRAKPFTPEAVRALVQASLPVPTAPAADPAVGPPWSEAGDLEAAPTHRSAWAARSRTMNVQPPGRARTRWPSKLR